MMMRRLPILLALLAVLYAGCDNVIEPISSDRTDSVAIYGLLDMRTDRQLLRLEALRSTILEQSSGLDGVSVRSIAEGTGSFQTWTRIDSTDTAGNPITLFEADFTPVIGTTYRVDVLRGDVVLSQARTTVPPRPRIAIGPVEEDGSTLTQTMYLTSVNGAPEHVQVAYTVVDIGEVVPVTVPVAYGRLAETPVPDVNVTVNFSNDRFVVMNQLRRDIDEEGVRFRGVSLTFDLPSPEWIDVQSDNVTGGLGFFASVGRYSYTWTLSDQTVSSMGWINEQ